MSWYANSKEKDFIINKNVISKKEYQALMILIFIILLFIYYYFTIDSYADVLEFIKLGRFVNRGTMYGPWLPVYGVVLILLLLKRYWDKPWLLFILLLLYVELSDMVQVCIFSMLNI